MVLGDLNLGNYTILLVEPLHDVKGHTINIFKELQSPHYLDDEAHRTLEDVLGAYLHKEKDKGHDYRYVCIFAYNALRNTSASKEILQILETLEITHVLYSAHVFTKLKFANIFRPICQIYCPPKNQAIRYSILTRQRFSLC